LAAGGPSGFAGALTATQSRVNGGLSQTLGNGYLTAAVSFGSGLLILCVIMLFSRSGREGVRLVGAELRSGRFPWWALSGGACGAFFVLGQGLAAPVIGLALFTVGVVAGQVLGGLVIDRIGVGPSGRIDPTVQRMVGAGLAVAAVVVSVVADLSGASSGTVLVVVPVVAGLLVAWQSAVNGLLRAAAHSALSATFLSFVIGTTILVVVAAVSVGMRGWPVHWPTQPWFYVGGALGAVFIAIAAVLVRTAGVLLLSMSNVAGQLIAAVSFEAGLPLAGGVTPWMLVGAAVALLAVLIAALPARATLRLGNTKHPHA
ncbi:MAG: DMT family transporter, partial [Actinobacteria bacterium]|nr:DMT family transporter [Actinomycetota bacterium]